MNTSHTQLTNRTGTELKKQFEQTVRAVSKTTLKNKVDERVKRRQLRYTKKILKDPLIFNI